jgi:tetraacyldisaccharide 4'-kinase
VEHPHPRPPLALGLLARAADLVARRRRTTLPRAGTDQLPTLAVHGLVLGGAGKTPLCAWLAERLAGRLGGPVAVGTRQRAIAGDEADLLRHRLRGSPVFARPDPRQAVEASRAAGCRAVVLDDPSLTRPAPAHFRIVCLRPGDGWTLPAFPAGERRPGCIRPEEADHLVLFDEAAAPPGVALPASRARTVATGLAPLERFRAGSRKPSRRASRDLSAFVLCAVARPERVLVSLQSLGAVVVGSRLLRDHSALPTAVCADAERQALAQGARVIVVTEKDAVRLGRTAAHRLPWLVLLTDLDLEEGGEALLSAFLARVALPDP